MISPRRRISYRIATAFMAATLLFGATACDQGNEEDQIDQELDQTEEELDQELDQKEEELEEEIAEDLAD
jgi:hypothetical protein